MSTYRAGLLSGALLAVVAIAGLAWIPSARPNVAQRPASAPAADDVAMVQTILAEARGSSLLLCEMASGTMRGNYWWRNREPVDEEVTRVIDWTRREHTDDAVVPVLAGALGDGDPCAARTAARLLGGIESAAATQALLQGLEDSSATVREMAALGLGVGEPEESLEPLLVTLSDDPAPPVRVMAAWALGQLEHDRAVDPLGSALGRSDDPALRAAAATALGEIEAPEAIPALVRALSDANARVRLSAAWALGEIEDPEAIPALARTLLEDDDPAVRRTAARALGNIDD